MSRKPASPSEHRTESIRITDVLGGARGGRDQGKLKLEPTYYTRHGCELQRRNGNDGRKTGSAKVSAASGERLAPGLTRNAGGFALECMVNAPPAGPDAASASTTGSRVAADMTATAPW